MEDRSRALSHSSAINRLTFLSVALLLWAAAICYKLISLQVIHHAKYAAIARSQQEEKVEIPAPRGSIFDRNGQPLAISVPVDSVSVNPQQIENLRLAMEVLGQHAEPRSAGSLSPPAMGAREPQRFPMGEAANRSFRN